MYTVMLTVFPSEWTDVCQWTPEAKRTLIVEKVLSSIGYNPLSGSEQSVNKEVSKEVSKVRVKK